MKTKYMCVDCDKHYVYLFQLLKLTTFIGHDKIIEANIL